MILGKCRDCGETFSFEDGDLGKQGVCPHCQSAVPLAASGSVTASPATPIAGPGAAGVVGARVRQPYKVKWAKPFESGSLRANLAVWLLALSAVLALAAFFSDWSEAGLFERAAAGEDISDAEAESNDTRQALLGLAQMGVMIAGTVFLMMWVHRSYRNLPALGARHLRFSPGWAVGYFFIPIVCFYRPYQAMADIWAGSAPEGGQDLAGGVSGLRDGRQNQGASALVGFWWAAWLVSMIAGQASFRIAMRADGLTELLNAARVSMVDDLTTVVSAILTILLVRAVQSRQEASYLAWLEAAEARERTQAVSAAPLSGA